MEDRHSLRRNFARLITTVLVTSLTLVACTSREERKVEYLNRAQSYFAEENFEKARIDVRNALQIDENYVEARYLYAQVLEQEQNWRQMLANLRLVLELDETHLPARIKHGTIMLVSRQFETATQEADRVLKYNPEYAEAYSLKAAVQFQQGNSNSAIELAQQALSFEPNNISAIAVLTQIHKTENPALALEVIAEGISQQSDSAALQLMRIAVFEANNNVAEATAAYDELLISHPDNLYYHYRYVTLLEANQQHDQAAALIRSIAQAKPDKVQLKLWLVQYLVNHQDVTAAESTLREYIAQSPEQADLQMGLGSILLAQNRGNEAREHYLALVSNQEETDLAQRSRMALAQLELRQGESEAAKVWLEEVLELEPENPDALLIQAAEELRGQNYTDAVGKARTVLRNRPESVPALGLLAEAHLRSNSIDLARDNFQQIIALEPQNSIALTKLATLSLRTGELETAREYAATAVRANPANSEAARLLVSAYTKEGNTTEALAQAQLLADSENSQVLGTYLLGAVHYANKNYPQAIEYFQSTLKHEPRAVEAQELLVNAFLATDNKAAAYNHLTAFSAEFPDNHTSRTLLAKLHLQDGDKDRAEAFYREAIRIAPAHPDAYEQLGAIQALAGDHAGALAIFDQGLAQIPDNVALLLRKAQAYEALGNPAEARPLYEEAIAANSELVVARNNLAVILTDHDGSPAALQQASELMRPYANSKVPVLLDTLGWVYYRLNDSEQAITYLQAAIDNGGTDPTMHFHLAMAQAQAGNSGAAKAAIEQALATNPTFPQADEAQALLSTL